MCIFYRAFIGPVAGGFINEQLGFHWSSTITAFMLASTVIMVILSGTIFTKKVPQAKF